MFRNLPRYDKYYRAPGRLQPQIPETWRWKRLASIGRQVSEGNHPDLPLLSVYLDRGVIPYAEGGHRVYAPSERLDAYQVVRPGDLVLNNQQAWRGSVGVSVHYGIISPAYVVWRNSSSIAHQFATFLFRSSVMVDQYVTASRGVGDIQRDLHGLSLRNVLVPVPPLEDQLAIARYLAHANARIDKAIAAKRRLIALLDERRVGVHSHLLLGATGNAARLKDFATVQTGLTLGKDYGSQDLTSYPYLRVANVQMGCVDTTSVSKVAVPERELTRFSLEVGDVLMTEGGDIDKLGRGTVWDGHIEPCLHQNHVFAVRCRAGLRPEYLAAWLAGPISREYFYLTAKKTTNLASTNSSTLGKLPITVPLLEEQDRLLSEIHFQTSPMVVAMGKAQREIDLLQEFRTRLVADVVTGQVDVRAIAATLPDAPESFDNTAPATDDDLEEALSEGEE